MYYLKCFLILLGVWSLNFSTSLALDIVQNGEARAVVVTGDDPVPVVRLAASELSAYVGKISGTELPVYTESELAAATVDPSWVHIYVGASKATRKHGVTDEGLEWGAYRTASGDNWIVLLGNDTRFEPQGIVGLTRNEWNNEAKAEWEELAGYDFGTPMSSLWKSYNKELDLWRQDQKGSLNAVYNLLRGLGVRWYNQGELGEVVPEMKTISVDVPNATVEPDFSKRIVAFARYSSSPIEEVLWTLRLGSNYPYGYAGDYHGMVYVTRSEYISENHPEYLALIGGERSSGVRRPKPCLSSEGLFDETVRYARLMFDVYDVPVVSLQPEDGFTTICQCEKCAGKDSLDRPRNGTLSNYVWDFINRVAQEIEKSHPGKLISCMAYSTYQLPPDNMEKLNDNVLVYIVNGRARYKLSDEARAKRLDLMRQWKEMSGRKIINFMNHGGAINTPTLIAEDIAKSKPYSMGEDLWVAFHRGGLAEPGYRHLNYYIKLRWMWDSSQDIDAVLEKYYTDYYGPVADEMAAFIDYFEREQYNMRGIDSAPLMGKALQLFDVAATKVDPDSIYGRRLAEFAVGLEPLRKRYEKFKAGRVDVPTYHLSRDTAEMAEIKIDGKLDEAFWSELPGELVVSKTGDEPEYRTRFKVGIDGNALYFGILCYDEPDEPLNAEVLEKQAAGIWQGDIVEIMLETPHNSYYQLGVNPRGSRVDLNRGAGGLTAALQWDSQAEFAAYANEEEGYWSIEARIPFTDNAQDPLHQIIGTPPTAENPWHFNIGRQRARNKRADLEATTFSPTGTDGFHEILRFGRLE